MEGDRPLGGNSAVVPVGSEAQTAQPDQFQLRELSAQETMADASLWMAGAAVLTFFVTFTGTILIWRQVRLTRQAVEDTSQATEAMREANVIARDNNRRELRPYLYPSNARFTMDDTHDVIAFVTNRNFGQTPALDTESWIHTWVECFPLHDPLPQAPDDLPKGKSVVGPGATGEFEHGHPLPLNEHSRMEIEAGRAALYVYGEIRYSDIFGKSHWSKYIYFASGPGSLQRGRLSAYLDGNEIDAEGADAGESG